ncbi:Aliphatic sulfonates import ATP-binding protein SsuB [invertebrate metagenome]|uniref:Aliphatic sulfonates import ATP-binding protein SsuB n=1 Tax=invertebrate metagenome TaxID=1711999 RepID=A0A2H9T7F0_9ZZZZ
MFDLHVSNASLAYGDHCIFRQLNLTLKGGCCTCLLGGSGVGKTSFLRFIAGLCTNNNRATTSGSVVCNDGHNLSGRIAWMAQKDLLLPWFTVLDNLCIGSKLRKNAFFRKKPDSHTHQKAMDILYRVGLDKKAGMLPQTLSGGQKQRVALARTLMEDRPIVLMDEPFGALDAITRINLQDLACELLKNKTVLLITHDPLEALRIGHYVYHLHGQPAQLTDAIIPPGEPPRSLDDQKLLSLQGILLDRLRHEKKDSLYE